MRNPFLASAVLLGVLATPAFAQTPPAPDSTERTSVAPKLPVPGIDENASPHAFLERAQQALERRRPGEAQEALERAETRMLDRSVVPSRAGIPDSSPGIDQIRQARDALARRDLRSAQQIIANALASGGSTGIANPVGPGMTAAPNAGSTSTPTNGVAGPGL
jgi:hypothetical protein